MRLTWSAPLLLAAACAAPADIRHEHQISPVPSPAGTFAVSDLGGEPETRRYRFKAEDLLAASSPSVLDVRRPSDGTREDLTPAALAEAAGVIRALVAPGTWDDTRHALYVEKDGIVARHVPSALAQVERLLETLKANRNAVFRLQVQFLAIPLDEMGVIRNLPPIREGLGGVIDRRTIVTLMKNRTPGRMTLHQISALTLHHGQSGIVSMASRFPYLKAAERKDADYSAVIDEVTSGLQLNARVVVDGPQSGRLLLDAALEHRDLASITSLRLGDHVVQVPAVTTSRSAGGFVLGPDEAAVLLGPPARAVDGILGKLGPSRSDPKQMTLYILQVVRVD